jgi:predicted dehydrogenase
VLGSKAGLGGEGVKNMKFAVIGCQHSHIKLLIDEMLELGHQFVGILDKSDYFLPGLYSKEYGVPLLDSSEEILDKGVDIVGNAASNDKKIDIIEWGESHGVHVMTDKPVAVDFEALDRLKKVMDRGRIQTGMMLTERFSPPLYTLRQMIGEGILGDIMDFTFLKPHKLNRTDRPGWFFRKSVNGGLVIDIMIHDVDLLRWFTDREINSFHGMLLKGVFDEYPEFYDRAELNILLDGQITATLKANWLMPEAFDLWGDGRIFATGSKGTAEIRSAGDVLNSVNPFIMLTTHNSRTVKYDVQKAPVGLMEDFINRIDGKASCLSNEDIYKCNEAVLKMDAACAKYVKN